tara:strand:+ start:9982 stop:10512 length:531 start_codon:yes stop_codon:yes gene_type:complete
MVAGKIELSKNEIKKDSIYQLNTNDESCNYMVAPIERTEKIFFGKLEQTPLDKVDYSFPNKTQKTELEKLGEKIKTPEESEEYIRKYNEVKDDKRNQLSFMNVKTIEEGAEWYKKEFPQLPDQITEIMARWNWGDLSQLTKKKVKQDKKKIAQGKTKVKHYYGLEQKKGKFVVSFN